VDDRLLDEPLPAVGGDDRPTDRPIQPGEEPRACLHQVLVEWQKGTSILALALALAAVAITAALAVAAAGAGLFVGSLLFAAAAVGSLGAVVGKSAVAAVVHHQLVGEEMGLLVFLLEGIIEANGHVDIRLGLVIGVDVPLDLPEQGLHGAFAFITFGMEGDHGCQSSGGCQNLQNLFHFGLYSFQIH